MDNERPLVLVTNDDGIYAEGIKVLAERMAEVGDVVTVAPDREKSAVSHSVTLHHPLRVTQIDERRYTVDGTPTDCVLLGVLSVLPRRPDILVSGINRGGNLGDDVTYSGTVAAAFEGTLRGVPSFAISVIERIDTRFEFAAEFAVRLSNLILDNGLPPETLLNVNVPNLAAQDIAGIAVARQGRRIYNDQIVEKEDPRGERYYWIAGTDSSKPDEGTDLEAVSRGMVSITPLHLNLTNDEYMDELGKWGLEG